MSILTITYVVKKNLLFWTFYLSESWKCVMVSTKNIKQHSQW